jgi:hypothetical protein
MTTALSISTPEAAQATATGQAPVSRRDEHDVSYVVPMAHGFPAIGMPE